MEDCDGRDRRGGEAWEGIVVGESAVSSHEQHGGWNRYSGAHNCTAGSRPLISAPTSHVCRGGVVRSGPRSAGRNAAGDDACDGRVAATGE